MTDSGWRIACDRAFLSSAPVFFTELTARLRHVSPNFALALNFAPGCSGDLALTLPPPVLPVCVAPEEVLCGPLFVPGQSTCPLCLQHWLAPSLRFDSYPAQLPGADLADLLGRQIAVWSDAFARSGELEQRALLERRPSELRINAVSVRAGRAAFAQHVTWPDRACLRCGSISRPLQPSLRVHCSRWTGIVKHLERTTSPVAGAFRASGTVNPSLPAKGVRRRLKQLHSYGRGPTKEAAETSCVGEAIERYSLVYRGDEPMMRARFVDVEAIHPDATQLFSDRQIRERDRWNEASDDDFWVPESFDPYAPVDWLTASSLSSARADTLVPAAACLMWYEFDSGNPSSRVPTPSDAPLGRARTTR